MGSPSTFMMRPSVPLPTGTVIAAPVFCTVMPRLSPSDTPIAMVRTTPSPSCCCTSSVRFASWSRSASYIFGMPSRGNSTSMTAPMIWVILPVLMISLCPSRRSALSDGRSAAHDFRQFLGDRGLARLVVDELQLADQLAGVVGCALHGDHARRHLAGDVLDGSAIYERFDVAHQEAVNDVRGRRLIDVVPVLLEPFAVARLRRQHLRDMRLLRHRRLEDIVQEQELVDLALAVGVEHDLDRADQVAHVRLVTQVRYLREHRDTQTPEELHGLGADEADARFLVLRLRIADGVQRLAEEIHVERTAEAAVRADDDEPDGLHRPRNEKRMTIIRIRLVQVADRDANLFRVRARSAHAFACTAHLARGHHFHGLGDLLSILDTRDLDADFLGAGH